MTRLLPGKWDPGDGAEPTPAGTHPPRPVGSRPLPWGCCPGGLPLRMRPSRAWIRVLSCFQEPHSLIFSIFFSFREWDHHLSIVKLEMLNPRCLVFFNIQAIIPFWQSALLNVFRTLLPPLPLRTLSRRLSSFGGQVLARPLQHPFTHCPYHVIPPKHNSPRDATLTHSSPSAFNLF